MEEQKQVNWLDKEAEELNKQASFDGEKLPSLQFEEGKVVKFKIDFSEPFKEFNDEANKCIKAIIPVEHKGEKKILWLNKKNPLYKDIIHKGKEGIKEFAVSQTGNKAKTQYHLLQDD